MHKSLVKELESLSPHFPEWTNTLQRHEEETYRNMAEEVSDEAVRAELGVHEICKAILGVCTRCGRYRDTWDAGTFMPFPFGQETTIKSRKVSAEFAFGCSHRDFFLSSYLHFPGNIRKMTDEFWACFIELMPLGHFRFVENASPSSQEARRIMKQSTNAKSNIFKLICNYLVLEAYGEGSDDVGGLEVKWPFTMPWNQLVENAVKAFGYLYNINYMLYKSQHMRRKGTP